MGKNFAKILNYKDETELINFLNAEEYSSSMVIIPLQSGKIIILREDNESNNPKQIIEE